MNLSLRSFPRIAALMLLAASPALFGQVQYFDDTPPSAPYFGVANRLWERQITKGCVAEPHLFCGDGLVTRGDMSALVVRALYSSLIGNPEGFTPPSTPYFQDVPPSDLRFRYIQQLRFLGITNGCTATTYCPDLFVTNSQVAVFAVRARQIRDTSIASAGYLYTLGTVNNAIACPGDFSCTPWYNDVPTSNSFFPWIQMARKLSGPMIQSPSCYGSNPYGFCPEDPITRGQIAFFLVYGVLGSAVLAPQASNQGGSGGPPYRLPPA